MSLWRWTSPNLKKENIIRAIVWKVCGLCEGAVERTHQRRMFAISIYDRSRETLNAIIEKYILPDSIVHTDCWAAYEGMEAHGMAHGTVNHTHNYVDPDTEVHDTNLIKGTWNDIKLNTNGRHYIRDFVDGSIHTLIWRRRYGGRQPQNLSALLWARLVLHVSLVRYNDELAGSWPGGSK